MRPVSRFTATVEECIETERLTSPYPWGGSDPTSVVRRTDPVLLTGPNPCTKFVSVSLRKEP